MNSTAAGFRPPFTAAQWQELEHQALIFKYLISGVPVPPELLIPIRRSFEALPGRYYHHPALGYCSYYGKKIDPEPGRCRRTDGKKWRCSKDAYPDSKYCERHMHRGRNRSRKPVESQTASQTPSSPSTVTSITPTESNAFASGSGGGSFQSIPLHSLAGHGNAQSSCMSGSSSSHLPINPGPFANRYCTGLRSEADEHSFFSNPSGSTRGMGVDMLGDSSRSLLPSRVSSFPLTKARDPSLLHSAYPELQSRSDLGQVTVSSYPRQHQHSFFGCDFHSAEPVKNESQPLRPFFDEWPKARDSWSDLEEERSNRNSVSTTQLSISIPMASSDFSATSSLSANGED